MAMWNLMILQIVVEMLFGVCTNWQKILKQLAFVLLFKPFQTPNCCSHIAVDTSTSNTMYKLTVSKKPRDLKYLTSIFKISIIILTKISLFYLYFVWDNHCPCSTTCPSFRVISNSVTIIVLCSIMGFSPMQKLFHKFWN